MPALAPYIPPRNADLTNWADNFSTLITAAPATYGLVSGDATAIAAVVAAWDAAFSAANDPSTRTPVTVQTQVDAKIDLLATVRPYSISISLNAGVSSAAKIAVGVNPRTSVPVKIEAPTTMPVLSVPQGMVLQHVLRYRDELSSPTVKAKPYGVVQLALWCTVSATPITDQDTLDYFGAFTKSPALIEFEPADAGKIAYYAGRWITRRGLLGPWSGIVSLTVANS